MLKIAPIEKSTPPEAEALAARLYAMLPRIRVTDLLSEVAGWTLFTDCFTHLRSGETVADPHVLMASLLADGLSLGLTRMAEACTIASLGQLAWVADWHNHAILRGRLFTIADRAAIPLPCLRHSCKRRRRIVNRTASPTEWSYIGGNSRSSHL